MIAGGLAVSTVAAAGAVAAAVPAPGVAGLPSAPRRRVVTTLGAVVIAVPLALSVALPVLVVAAIAVVAALVGRGLLRRHALLRQAAEVRLRVIETCETVQVELGAGQSPGAALRFAAEAWPALEPVARVARAGGDVPAALRELARTPGAIDLRVVGAAWQVAHRTGHGLADTVGRVAADLRAAEQTRRVVVSELASARATARLVAVLPLAALVLGSGAGADPWSFLLGTPLGWACLAGGLGCCLAGLTWIEALAADVERGR